MKFIQRISSILPQRVSNTVHHFVHISCRAASSSALARPEQVSYYIILRNFRIA